MPNKYKKNKHAVAFGIRSWLLSQRYIMSKQYPDQVDKSDYKALLKEFCESQPDYIPSKHIESKEGFIALRSKFALFQIFCAQKYRNNNIIVKTNKK